MKNKTQQNFRLPGILFLKDNEQVQMYSWAKHFYQEQNWKNVDEIKNDGQKQNRNNRYITQKDRMAYLKMKEH